MGHFVLELNAEPTAPETSAPTFSVKPKWRQAVEIVTDLVKEYGQFFYLFAAIYMIPIILVVFIPASRSILFWIGSAAILVTTTWLIGEAASSFKCWRDSRALHSQPLPADLPLNVAAIVSAYLPNEIGVIYDTIQAVRSLRLPRGGRLHLVVAHNGGSADDMDKLADIIYSMENKQGAVDIHDFYVELSRSKAENVNAAIQFLSDLPIEPQVCVMFDADHQPDENGMVYALQTMHAKRADLLQGRCVISRGSSLLAAEFDTIYGVNHAGGYVLRNFAFFGGTNGYWNFELLKQIKMDESMLTEDIDSSFRSLGAGAVIVFDPLVASHEEAPDSLNSLLKQRLRWAQGWSQVAVRHLALLKHSEFSLYKKFNIFLVLHWREIFYYLTPLTLPAAVTSILSSGEFAFRLLALTAVQMCVPPLLSLLARYHVRNERHPDLGPWAYIKYLTIAPIYDWTKNAVCVLGHFRNACKMTKWRVTTRSS